MEESKEERMEGAAAAAAEAEAGQPGAAQPDSGDKTTPAPEKGAAAEAGDGADKPKEQERPKEPDWKDMYARLLADFDNFKKRTARDREDSYRFAEADILGDVLPAVDNLALALEKAEDKENSFVKGVQLVYDSLLRSLEGHGAKPFDSVGLPLDTERMEAIATLPSDAIEEGKVSTEVKRGWMLRDKVLRAAQVVVSAGKANG